ncbi:MAG: diguanylate cyclase [Sporomusaceae bacterium]|nr:diguanylate cyclase [Sporomusaceae bacterium]
MNFGKQTVLVVDDEKFHCNLLMKILQDNYSVYCATSGSQALKIIISRKIDLILLDIMLPDIDGYEICRRVKENPATQDIVVIFISSNSSPRHQTTGFSMGAVDYITKNTDIAVVKARIESQLELKKQRDILVSLSMIDKLTEIYNRRFLEEALNKLCLSSYRNNEYLSAIMIDIDFFKNYNDIYGHLEGDECLRMVSQTIKNSLSRSIDIVGRYGGEEFVVLLPATPLSGAIVVAQRIQENIKKLALKHEMSDVSEFVTVSMGVASLKPNDDYKPAKLIKRADIGLYNAKREGRNCYISIEE